jgi:RHS repeat-associated protein
MCRIRLSPVSVNEAAFWSVTGQRVGFYNLVSYGGALKPVQTGTEYYFGGKLVKNAGGYVHADRLGSIGKYYPYGQERPSATQNGVEKFATYFRDADTALDYADQRYHAPGQGRFLTPDPYVASGKSNDPGSWNRYLYSTGDPINFVDPSGLVPCGSYSEQHGDVISETVYDCVGMVPNPIRAVQPVETIQAFNDFHGILPRCDALPKLPSNIASDQIQQNVDTANLFFDLQLQLSNGGAEGALPALLGFLTGKFVPGGGWDYKSQYQPGTADYNLAKTFGNFNFGAVLESLGFTYYATQNAAGVAQIGICVLGGACGTGAPAIVFPYGDQIPDAAEIKGGYDYQAKKDSGCNP